MVSLTIIMGKMSTQRILVGVFTLVVFIFLAVSAQDEMDNVIYETTLSSGLYPGNAFIAKLYLHPGIKWFRINLQTNPGNPSTTPETEVAFTMRISLDPYESTKNMIERDWLDTNGAFQLNPAEKSIFGLFPFFGDNVFEVTLLCNMNNYEIHINSYKKFQFTHKATTGTLPDFDVIRIMAEPGTVDICGTGLNTEQLLAPTAASTVNPECSRPVQRSLCDSLVCYLFSEDTNIYTSTANAVAMDADTMVMSGQVSAALEVITEQFCCLEGLSKDISALSKQDSLQMGLDIVTLLFTWKSNASWHNLNQLAPNGPMSLMNQMDDLAQSLSEGASSGLQLQASTPTVNVNLQVKTLDEWDDWSFKPDGNREDSISIKKSDLAQLGLEGSTKLTVFSAAYTDLTGPINMYQQGVEGPIASDVISLTIFGPDGQISVPTSFNRKIIDLDDNEEEPTYPVCVSWDYHVEGSSVGGWSDRGCHRVLSAEQSIYDGVALNDYITCQCNHTTNYAVLMRIVPTDQQLSPADASTLRALTVVGCLLSILALLFALGFFFFFKHTSLDTERILIHRNLMGGLLAAMLFFLISTFLTQHRIPCQIFAALLHYLYLAVFCWMLVEGIHLYRLIVTVYGSEKQMAKIYYSIGWGVPVLIVIISAAAKWTDYGIPDVACWLSPANGFIWAFAAPACVIMLVNSVVLALVLRTTIMASKLSSQDNLMRVKTSLRSSLVLLPMLGITWAIGLLTHIVAFQYIFVILNSFQGVWLVIVCCVMNGEVRNAFKHTINKKLGQFSGTVDVSSSSTATTEVTKMPQKEKKAKICEVD